MTRRSPPTCVLSVGSNAFTGDFVYTPPATVDDDAHAFLDGSAMPGVGTSVDHGTPRPQPTEDSRSPRTIEADCEWDAHKGTALIADWLERSRKLHDWLVLPCLWNPTSTWSVCFIVSGCPVG